MKQWYEALFENYADSYEQECFVHGTIGECDFIEREIDFRKHFRILDIGCGTGRHSIELAGRGYAVTGIDLSASMLEKAEKKAQDLSLDVTFKKEDARKLSFMHEFDLVIMLCEGAFPLMETDRMNYEILKHARNALVETGGKLIFTTLNGLFPLFHSIKEFLDSQTQEGNVHTSSSSFDLMTFRDSSSIHILDDSGDERILECSERYYVPSEITWLLSSLGFRKIDIFGAHLGDFSRSHPLTTEDYEMLVIAET